MAIKTVLYDDVTYSLSYELLNLQKSKSILFLHGWGSTKEVMKSAFRETFDEYQHIYLDLPGFGHSSINTPINTADYAHIVAVFLNELRIKPDMIFGHSFGGKVATLLQPECLVFLSTAGIVVPKSFKIKMKIGIYKFFKPLFPRHFYRFFASKDIDGMSDVMYGTFKKVVDEDFSSLFASICIPTYIFWGKEDRATPLSSGEKIHNLIKNSHFFPINGDHFFFLKNGKKIENLLLEFMS